MVKVDKFIFPANFIVLDVEGDEDVTLILGRPFLYSGRILIDVQQGKPILRVEDKQVAFDVFKFIDFPFEVRSCFQINDVSLVVVEIF